MTDARTDGRVVGSVRSIDGSGAVRLEARFDASLPDVWSALTDPRRLSAWMGEADGDLRQGGVFRAHWLASGWEGTVRIDTCEPLRRILLATSSPDEPEEPDGVIEATLDTDGGQTVLVVEDRGLPIDNIAAYGAGNQIHVEDLAAHLDGRERCDARTRFGQLHPSWQERARGLG